MPTPFRENIVSSMSLISFLRVLSILMTGLDSVRRILFWGPFSMGSKDMGTIYMSDTPTFSKHGCACSASFPVIPPPRFNLSLITSTSCLQGSCKGASSAGADGGGMDSESVVSLFASLLQAAPVTDRDRARAYPRL